MYNHKIIRETSQNLSQKICTGRNNQNMEYSQWLSQSHKELEKVKQVNERLSSENRELKLDIYNLKTVDKQLAKKDGQIDEGNETGNPY